MSERRTKVQRAQALKAKLVEGAESINAHAKKIKDWDFKKGRRPPHMPQPLVHLCANDCYVDIKKFTLAEEPSFDVAQQILEALRHTKNYIAKVDKEDESIPHESLEKITELVSLFSEATEGCQEERPC